MPAIDTNNMLQEETFTPKEDHLSAPFIFYFFVASIVLIIFRFIQVFVCNTVLYYVCPGKYKDLSQGFGVGNYVRIYGQLFQGG